MGEAASIRCTDPRLDRVNSSSPGRPTRRFPIDTNVQWSPGRDIRVSVLSRRIRLARRGEQRASMHSARGHPVEHPTEYRTIQVDGLSRRRRVGQTRTRLARDERPTPREGFSAEVVLRTVLSLLVGLHRSQRPNAVQKGHKLALATTPVAGRIACSKIALSAVLPASNRWPAG